MVNSKGVGFDALPGKGLMQQPNAINTYAGKVRIISALKGNSLSVALFPATVTRAKETTNGNTEGKITGFKQSNEHYALAEFKPNYKVIGRMSAKLANECIDILKAGGGEVYKADCFITSAACHIVGLADDCWELSTLREFRDHHMRKLEGGAEDIHRYYQCAPGIARNLLASEAGRKVLLKHYWLSIVPSALLAKVGAHRACYYVYKRMMSLLEKYQTV